MTQEAVVLRRIERRSIIFATLSAAVVSIFSWRAGLSP